MHGRKATPERLGAFSDGVIAVIITIMVLELKPPEGSGLAALLPLWPTLLSYVVSYLFVGIVWVNHHHLLRYTDNATPWLIWSNLGFLFAVSLIPFATAWIAATRIAAIPVALYAMVFCLVNLTYIVFEKAVLAQQKSEFELELQRLRRRSRRRSTATLLVYGGAGAVALRHAVAGFVLIFLNTLVYVLPGVFPGVFASHAPAQPDERPDASMRQGE